MLRVVAMLAFLICTALPAAAQVAVDAGFGAATGTFPVNRAAGKTVRFSGYIKSDGVTTGYASLWWRVDGPPGTPNLGFANLGPRGATGTADWRPFTVELPVGVAAQNINFGVMLVGDGTAWFDDLAIDVGGQAFSDPQFDLGFESPELRGLFAAGGGYRTTLDNTVTHSGRQSLRMSHVGVAPISDPSWPFTMKAVAPFHLPWRIAFLPNGNMLVTEKTGALWFSLQNGVKTLVRNVPRSEFLMLTHGYYDNGGMLGVYVSPHYATDHNIYLTYSEPGSPSGSGLALARARLLLTDTSASLENLQVIWRDGARGTGGQVGGAVAFSPDGQFLFLALGDRNRIWPSQDPDQPVGKILRLTLDGKPAPGNPQAGKIGAKSVGIIDWQNDTDGARNAPPLYTYTFPGDNLTPSETWSTGHRNPLGLVFTPDGRLWELEHGPRGGDELNVIEPGENYGWPVVSYGAHYNGTPIPHPVTRPDLAKPALQWTPVIAPGNLALYTGPAFPQWNGSGLIAGLGSRSLIRITFDGKGGAAEAERWNLGHEIRDVAVGPDGSVWLLINEMQGGLFRLTPK